MNTHIELVITQLHEAITENIQASQAETEAKQRKIKAHYNLQKAREELNDLIRQSLA